MDPLTESVREAYTRFLLDEEAAWCWLAPDVVFHVAGRHPLSGDHVGREAVRRYLAMVTEATHGRGGFTVTSAFPDDSGELLLVEGTAFHGEEPFVRTIIHLLRLRDGLLVEFWDNPFDQRAEDRFWADRIPGQRAEGSRHRQAPARGRDTGDSHAADSGRTDGIPAQMMRAFGHS